MNEMSARHLRWPADRFYWAVIDASGLPRAPFGRRRHSGRRLGYVLEGVVPGMPIEGLHAVYRPLPGDGGRYIACALPQEALQELDGGPVTLTPQQLPPFVAGDIEAESLNLLTGDFTPKALRRLRGRACVELAVALAVLVCVAIAGFERRTQAARRQLDEIAAAKTAILDQVLDPAADSGGQPPELRLVAEKRRLERTRDADVSVARLPSAAASLSALLAHWPSDVHAETESVSVAPGGITVRANVPSMAEAQRLADAFRRLAGWRLRQPQSQARRDRVGVVLHLEREGGP